MDIIFKRMFKLINHTLFTIASIGLNLLLIGVIVVLQIQTHAALIWGVSLITIGSAFIVFCLAVIILKLVK